MRAEPVDNHFVFLDYLRFFAAWTVVYDHVLGKWTGEQGVTLHIVSVVRKYIANPLGIIQDFGWMAVAIFFLISGFIITHVSSRETTAEFLVKRLFRIFPMLAFFVSLSIALNPQVRAQVTPFVFLQNITLVNYFSAPQVITVGVAWTLIIEVLFYLQTALTSWTRNQYIIIITNLLIPFFAIKFSRDFGADFFLLAASLSYIPYLVVGQIFYFGLYRRSIGLTGMTVSVAACFAILLYGIMSILTNFLPVTNSYLIDFIYACIIFCLFFHLNQKLAQNVVIKFLSASSFAVYLVHGVVGYAVFTALWQRGYHHLAIDATLATTVFVAAFVHLIFEKPIISLGHRFAGYLRPKMKSSEPSQPLPISPQQR